MDMQLPSTPVNVPVSPAPVEPEAPKAKHSVWLNILIVLLVVATLGVAGGTYAYVHGWRPIFFHVDSGQVISKMFANMATVNSAHYDLGFQMQSEPRQAGIAPIVTDLPELAKQKQVLTRDGVRLTDLVQIVSFLSHEKQLYKQYPADLATYFKGDKSILLDPVTQQSYAYQPTGDGTDFTLTVQLETDTAAQAYRKSLVVQAALAKKPVPSGEVTRSLVIHADTPPVYVYLGSDYNWGDTVYQYLPVELKAQLNIGGQSQLDTSKSNDAAYTASGKLELGSTSFGAGLDIVKKAEDFYVRLNDAPSFGFFDLAALKGKWVKITPDDTKNSSLGAILASPSKSVNNQSGRFIKQFELLFKVLDQDKVITVVKELPMEKINTVQSYHYEITLAEPKLADAYRDFTTQLQKDFGDAAIVQYAKETEDYLRTQEFATTYAAEQKKTTVELWVDATSYLPTRVSYTYTFVPPNSVEKLKGTEYRSQVTVGLTDINKPIVVTAPVDTISVIQAQSLMTGQSVDEIQKQGNGNVDARIKSDVGQLRTLAEVYYDSNKASYVGYAQCVDNPTATTCKGSVENSIDSLKKDLSDATKGVDQLHVKADATAFCISDNLTGDQFVCVDASGQFTDSATTKCGTAPIKCLP
jgi:hypothetical protein